MTFQLYEVFLDNLLMIFEEKNDTTPPPIYVEYDGNRCTTGPSPKLGYLSPGLCRHMEGTEGAGDIF